ncbi:hypothetical protein N9H39_10630 [Gammaproteobacteria bacterium]|nr:hypothetical protein [Gammaproteobacteria bacterium]
MTIKKWLDMSRQELDQVYQNALPGPVPRGETRGTAIVTGSLLAKVYALFARLFAWQGKIFDLYPPEYKQGMLINKVTAFKGGS